MLMLRPVNDLLSSCDAGKPSDRCAKCKVQQATAPCTLCRERQKAEEEREARRTARFGESAHARQQRVNDAALGGRVSAGRRDFLGYYELLGLNGDGSGEVVRSHGLDSAHCYAYPLQLCSCPIYVDLGLSISSAIVGVLPRPGRSRHPTSSAPSERRHSSGIPTGETALLSRTAAMLKSAFRWPTHEVVWL
jgi:hypothetical protein